MHKLHCERRCRSHVHAAAGLAALLGVLVLCAPGIATAQSLESFVLAAGGNSSGPLGGCTTFGPPAAVSAFFNISIGVPLDGYAAAMFPATWSISPARSGRSPIRRP